MSQVEPSAATPHKPHQSFWLWVMCLTGVDYFSTLGYQPSIAFDAAGMLGPLATIVLIAVTLFGALPIYIYVAQKSFQGQGSISMLARHLSGWPGKILVLVLLGFAGTDFVITKTLSAADAAEHLIQNPLWPLRADEATRDTPDELKQQLTEDRQHSENHQRMLVTFLLLVFLGAMFMRGFKEVIGFAVVLVGLYLLLNLIVVGNGLIYLVEHPHRFTIWWERVLSGENNWYIADSPSSDTGLWSTVILVFLIFPKLALGLSGFETGVAVMPLIRGHDDDDPNNPAGRIHNTKKLLRTAAIIMSAFLLGSSLIVSTLIPPSAFSRKDSDAPDKKYAKDRALAYLAHGDGQRLLPEEQDQEIKLPVSGEIFGTIYDLSTVVILWFAGASAMAGLLNLVPQYLPKYGMAPEWARAVRPLVLLLTGINLLVTYLFRANVNDQGGAYATGVLVLITSACVASIIEKLREHPERTFWKRVPWGFCFITVVFVYTTIAVVIEKPDGIKIAAFFIFAILVTSLISRILRARELRFSGFRLKDGESKLFWDTIKHLEMSVLVPHRPGRRSLAEKEETIRTEHRIPREIMMIFVEVELTDASEFIQEPWLEIREEEGRYVMKISHAASIAHTLAAAVLEMGKVGKPPEIHFGWTNESPWSGTLGFLLFGEGNVPTMVRELLLRAEPNVEKRPLVVVAGK